MLCHILCVAEYSFQIVYLDNQINLRHCFFLGSRSQPNCHIHSMIMKRFQGPNVWVISLQLILLCSITHTCFGFASLPEHQIRMKTKLSQNTKLDMILTDRRSSISRISTATFFGAVLSGILPQSSFAKEPVTSETLAKSFAEIHFELENPNGGIALLENAIKTKDWANVKEFTKFYDAEFRKAKMVKTRKMFPDPDMKGEALQLCNNVTFDLIGINRASRVEDVDSALKYLDELKGDISTFLDYESKITLP